MVRKQVLWAREHSREISLEKMKSRSEQKKLAFNITYHLDFQNVKYFIRITRITCSSNNRPGTSEFFQEIPVVRFQNSRSLKDHSVRVKLPNIEITGRSKSCGKKNSDLCFYMRYRHHQSLS